MRLISTKMMTDDEQVGDDHGPVEHVDRVYQKLAHARPAKIVLVTIANAITEPNSSPSPSRSGS